MMDMDHYYSLTIQFQDSGSGISKEELSRIFIPFFTTKSKGTGLGLSICQRIIKGLGGFIEVQSQTGQGSTFSVQLPVSGFGTSEIPAPATQGSPEEQVDEVDETATSEGDPG